MSSNNIKIMLSMTLIFSFFIRGFSQIYYKDQSGSIYGPFTNEQIWEWYDAGYFDGNVLIARSPHDKFESLQQMLEGRSDKFLPASEVINCEEDFSYDQSGHHSHLDDPASFDEYSLQQHEFHGSTSRTGGIQLPSRSFSLSESFTKIAKKTSAISSLFFQSKKKRTTEATFYEESTGPSRSHYDDSWGPPDVEGSGAYKGRTKNDMLRNGQADGNINDSNFLSSNPEFDNHSDHHGPNSERLERHDDSSSDPYATDHHPAGWSASLGAALPQQAGEDYFGENPLDAQRSSSYRDGEKSLGNLKVSDYDDDSRQYDDFKSMSKPPVKGVISVGSIERITQKQLQDLWPDMTRDARGERSAGGSPLVIGGTVLHLVMTPIFTIASFCLPSPIRLCVKVLQIAYAAGVFPSLMLAAALRLQEALSFGLVLLLTSHMFASLLTSELRQALFGFSPQGGSTGAPDATASPSINSHSGDEFGDDPVLFEEGMESDEKDITDGDGHIGAGYDGFQSNDDIGTDYRGIFNSFTAESNIESRSDHRDMMKYLRKHVGIIFDKILKSLAAVILSPSQRSHLIHVLINCLVHLHISLPLLIPLLAMLFLHAVVSPLVPKLLASAAGSISRNQLNLHIQSESPNMGSSAVVSSENEKTIIDHMRQALDAEASHVVELISNSACVVVTIVINLLISLVLALLNLQNNTPEEHFPNLVPIPFAVTAMSMLMELYAMTAERRRDEQTSDKSSITDRGDDLGHITTRTNHIRNRVKYIDDLLSGRTAAGAVDRWSLRPSLTRLRDNIQYMLSSLSGDGTGMKPDAYGHFASISSILSHLFGETRRLLLSSVILLSSVLAFADFGLKLSGSEIYSSSNLKLDSILNTFTRAVLPTSAQISYSRSSLELLHLARSTALCGALFSVPFMSWVTFHRQIPHLKRGMSAAAQILTRHAQERESLNTATERARKDALEAPEGWTTDGPDPRAGLQLFGVDIMHTTSSKQFLKDTTITFPAGCITLVVGGSPEAPYKSALLRAIWGDDDVIVCRGEARFRGRPLPEWDAVSLRDRILLLREDEERMWLPAGLIAGLSESAQLEDVERERQQRALVGSGADKVLQSLPLGAQTVLSSETMLSAAQWRSLALCRALCHLHKDLVLLDCPTSCLSETYEAEFFRVLRAGLRRDQVVLVTSARFASAAHADRVVVLAEGGVLQEGTYAQLISQPGPFRDELMPPPKSLFSLSHGGTMNT